MAYTTIDDSSEHFQTKIWTGNATSRTIDLDSHSTMQPDFSWVKTRSVSQTHYLVDSSTGTDKYLRPQMSAGQQSATVVTFNSTGIGLASGVEPNTNTETVVGWFWKANGGTRTTFTESGANPGGGYQVNTDAGFSIVDYTGTGSAGTVSHGLGAKPDFIIVKRLDGTTDWNVYHEINTEAPETDYLRLNTTHATSDVTTWNDTAPTTSVFSVSDDSAVNGNDNTYIAFCWAGVQGFSHFGGFFGSGGAGGPFVWTGFTPEFILIKEYTGTASWGIWDHKRDEVNPNDKLILVNASDAEYTGAGYRIDFLSNGFKLRNTDGAWNGNGDYYIFAAFAKYPVVTSNGVPATAI